MELTLELEDDVYATLERRAENNGFESTAEYAATILRLVTEELEDEAAANEVEERLEDLGYLN